jgi:hypothetical protein
LDKIDRGKEKLAVESFLDRAGKIIAILAGLTGISGAVVGLVNAVQRPRVQLQIDKARGRIPPKHLARLSKIEPGVFAEYQDPRFGTVTLDVTNLTDKEVTATLELGGLEKFSGVELLNTTLSGKHLDDYKDALIRLDLQRGAPCESVKAKWPDRPNLKLDIRLPPLQSYGGHITLAVYGVGFDRVDACLNGAPVDTRYLIRIQDSAMLHRYPVWLVTLSLILFGTAAVLLIQSQKRKKIVSSPRGADTVS